MEPVEIRESAVAEMLEHARREYPLECCGLLWGQGKVVEGVYAATNERRSRTEFQIPPRELIDFMKSIRREEKEFMGIYHSHPQGPAHPSRRDAAEFHYRDVSYWIVSLQDGGSEVRSYQWTAHGFQERRHRIHQETGLGNWQ